MSNFKLRIFYPTCDGSQWGASYFLIRRVLWSCLSTLRRCSICGAWRIWQPQPRHVCYEVSQRVWGEHSRVCSINCETTCTLEFGREEWRLQRNHAWGSWSTLHRLSQVNWNNTCENLLCTKLLRIGVGLRCWRPENEEGDSSLLFIKYWRTGSTADTTGLGDTAPASGV